MREVKEDTLVSSKRGTLISTADEVTRLLTR